MTKRRGGPLTEPDSTTRASGPGLDNLLKAREHVSNSLAAHLGAIDATEVPAISLSYVGALHRAGHFAKPGQVKSYSVEGCYALDGRQGRVAHRGKLVSPEPVQELTTFTVVTESGACAQEYGAPDAKAIDAEERAASQAEILRTLPHEILWEALQESASLRWLGEHPLAGAPHLLVSYVDRQGLTWNLYVDQHTRLLTRAERLLAHPVEGDSFEWFEFSEHIHAHGMQLPRRRREQRIEPWSSWSREISLTSFELGDPDEAMFSIPEGVAGASFSPMLQAKVLSFAEGVYLIELPKQDCSVMFVEFADHTFVLEAPLSSEVGETIIEAVNRTLPGKPVRFLAMSHHHPHYAGALRPFVHAGVSLVTTPGNKALLASIAGRPHRIDPDAQDRDPRTPRFEFVEGWREFSDDSASLQVFDVGPESDHTDEYLVFYHPEHRILFEGDLGWFASEGSAAAVRRGARRVLAVIDRLERPVECVVQSWPLAGHARATTVEEIRNLAQVEGDE